jgi:2-methylcitrate dehydratase PrpD
LSRPVFDLHGNFAAYKAKFEALLSAHYIAAAILHDRALTLSQFEPLRYNDAKLRRFAERIEVRAEPGLAGVAAVVDIETDSGERYAARCDEPLGAPDNKLSRTQVEAKFRSLAAARLSPSEAEEVIGEVVRLEHCGSVQTLMEMLRAAGRHANEPRSSAAKMSRG